MTTARQLFKQLQDEMYETIKNKPYITKQQIEMKMSLEAVPHSLGGKDWFDEFYAIVTPLLNEGKIIKVARGTFKIA